MLRWNDFCYPLAVYSSMECLIPVWYRIRCPILAEWSGIWCLILAVWYGMRCPYCCLSYLLCDLTLEHALWVMELMDTYCYVQITSHSCNLAKESLQEIGSLLTWQSVDIHAKGCWKQRSLNVYSVVGKKFRSTALGV